MKHYHALEVFECVSRLGVGLAAVDDDRKPELGCEIELSVQETALLDRCCEVVEVVESRLADRGGLRMGEQLAKDETLAAELDRTLYDLVDGLRAVAIALAAYLPETVEQILTSLGQPFDLSWDGVAYGRTAEVHGIAAAAPLFPRIDTPTAAA